MALTVTTFFLCIIKIMVMKVIFDYENTFYDMQFFTSHCILIQPLVGCFYPRWWPLSTPLKTALAKNILPVILDCSLGVISSSHFLLSGNFYTALKVLSILFSVRVLIKRREVTRSSGNCENSCCTYFPPSLMNCSKVLLVFLKYFPTLIVH